MIPSIINNGFPPSLIFIIGALLVPLLKGRAKTVWLLILPIAAFGAMAGASAADGPRWVVPLLDFGPGYDMIFGRIDSLSRIFATIFILISLVALIYSLNTADDLQYVSGLFYAGGALGVTLAGDLFTLYVFWEIMAVASTFLVLARRTKEAQAAAFRYILVHVAGGLFLLAGIVLYIRNFNTTEFSVIGLHSPAGWLLLIGVAVNAAAFPIHGWLKDAYPQATLAGAVFLSAFTTKSAVYVMARMFTGTELLIWLGAATAVIPVFYALVEDDIRRIMAYSLISQVGFMLCAVGIGSQLAVNGAAAHAFCHILYKALFFMVAGAVIQATGKNRLSELGGLYKSMPVTCACCLVASASISAFPLFNGFVSKSMIISAAAHEHLTAVWLILEVASAGTMVYAGLRLPFFMFFGEDKGIRAKDAPANMLIAMGIAAFLCVYLAVDYKSLYRLLPFVPAYHPYSPAHVVGQLQLLLFAALAFFGLVKYNVFPEPSKIELPDTDLIYRKAAQIFTRMADVLLNGLNDISASFFIGKVTKTVNDFGTNAPARLAMMVASPFKSLYETEENGGRKLGETIDRAFASGSVPIGITAALSTLFIVLLFCLI
jgi:multicomponent Na+:H+ antiporter subunit D